MTVFRVALLVVVIGAATAAAQAEQVTGTLTYREAIALPPTAIVEVTLDDVSRVDVASSVVARAEIAWAGQSPIPFAIEYEPSAIDPGGRYAVRARIVDRGQVLFAAARPVLVITQGRGLDVTVPLTMISAPSALPAVERMQQEARVTDRNRLPPPADLRNLPASFTGTISTPGGTSRRYQLDLFPDDSYFLRTTPVGAAGDAAADSLGSWVLSSDRRSLMLEGESGRHQVFAIHDANTLRLTAIGSSPVASGARDLRRASRFRPVDLRTLFRGVYEADASGAYFTECRSGQRWRVSPSSTAQELASAVGASGVAGAPAALIAVEGQVLPAQALDGPVLEVARVMPSPASSLTATGACERRFSAAPLENTSWRLTHLGSLPIEPGPGGTTELSVTFRDNPRAFGGSGGCNHLAGGYHVGDEELRLQPVGTLRACQSGNDVEAVFRTALTDTRSYRILGRTLELLDAERHLLARFEAE